MGRGPKVSKITEPPDIAHDGERTPILGWFQGLFKNTEKRDTQEYDNQKPRGMGLSEGPRRSFATDDPTNVSISVLWVEGEKEDRGTLIQRNRKFLDPIMERELGWAAKMGSLKRGKGGPSNIDTCGNRQEATKKALFIPLTTWINDPRIMGKSEIPRRNQRISKKNSGKSQTEDLS